MCVCVGGGLQDSILRRLEDGESLRDDPVGPGELVLARDSSVDYGNRLPEVDGDTVIHFVTASDTMQGLCIRYHCTETDLRRLNKMTSSTSLFTMVKIRVPRPPNYTPE